MNIIETYFSEDEVENLGFASVGKNVKIKKNVGIVGTENISISERYVHSNIEFHSCSPDLSLRSDQPMPVVSTIRKSSALYRSGSVQSPSYAMLKNSEPTDFVQISFL